MELAVYNPGAGGFGFPGIPDWVWDWVPLPNLQDLVYGIARGIWTSYYRSGVIVARRAASVELQKLLSDLKDGFETTLSTIRTSDPVERLVEGIEAVREENRLEAIRLLRENPPVNLAELGNTISEAANTAGSLIYNVASSPADGYNALADGVHVIGQWIGIVGPDGGTQHYSVPSWIFHLLDELERDSRLSLTQTFRATKRNITRPEDEQDNKKRRVLRSKPTKTSQKRRSGRLRNSSTKRKN
ncbi:viral protein 3 [possum polyomavirus]|nr:viral protein 3 [possum polyomavirus]